MKMIFSTSYSYGGFRKSNLELPIAFELLGMENQIELKQIRVEMVAGIATMKAKVGYLKKKLKVFQLILIGTSTLFGVLVVGWL